LRPESKDAKAENEGLRLEELRELELVKLELVGGRKTVKRQT